MIDYLALVQGITEFLPVSSSFHLLLLEKILHIKSSSFDVVLHSATLFSICLFFRKDLVEIVKGFLKLPAIFLKAHVFRAKRRNLSSANLAVHEERLPRFARKTSASRYCRVVWGFLKQCFKTSTTPVMARSKLTKTVCHPAVPSKSKLNGHGLSIDTPGHDGLFYELQEKIHSSLQNEWLLLLIATLPAVIIGFFVKKWGLIPSLEIMSYSSIVFGLLLYFADQCPQDKKHITYKDALIIGIGQVFAFIPGASRLGCTLTTARFLRIPRALAARFSFLLSIPTVLGALVLSFRDQTFQFALWGVTSLIGYCALFCFMKYVEKYPLWPFVVYRILLGVLILSFK